MPALYNATVEIPEVSLQLYTYSGEKLERGVFIWIWEGFVSLFGENVILESIVIFFESVIAINPDNQNHFA